MSKKVFQVVSSHPHFPNRVGEFQFEKNSFVILKESAVNFEYHPVSFFSVKKEFLKEIGYGKPSLD